MNTYIYMVRHGESPKLDGGERERTRGLTKKGSLDAHRVTDILKTEGIDTFISSPYKRAVLTIEKTANLYEKEILIYENLKECMFSSGIKLYQIKKCIRLYRRCSLILTLH